MPIRFKILTSQIFFFIKTIQQHYAKANPNVHKQNLVYFNIFLTNQEVFLIYNDELNLSYQSSGNELDESQPFLKQNKQIKFIKPPKAQNELTKLIGQRKRFGSKVHRETQKESEKYSQEKEEMQNTQTMRRSIQIMPFKEIKKKIETHKSETNRNIIKNQTQRLQQKQTQKMNVNLNQTQSYLNSSLHSAYKNDQKFRTQKLSSSKIQDLSNEEGNKKNPNQISLSREQEQLQITTESVSFRNPTKKLSEDSFFIGLMQENNQDLDQSLKNPYSFNKRQ